MKTQITPTVTEKWYCPYCGDDQGEPVAVTSSEYQGDSPHGGIVEWSDEMCTLCAPKCRGFYGDD